tara:strand:- start:6814 stop:7107 length:294 start_codon:yes stop_codon:yes gene_type:complete
MAVGRYTFVNRIDSGKGFSSPESMRKIYNGVLAGVISVSFIKLKEGQRLDTLAAEKYGRSDYWWIIAAASGIGWGLQCPPGTILRVPNNLAQALSVA